MENLTLDRWDRMLPVEKEVYAVRLARQLPQGFAFRSLQQYELGGQQHHMAVFKFDEACFVLVPGGTVTLGFDAARLWEPTLAEQQSWQSTAAEYDVTQTAHDYLVSLTHRPRKVHVTSLLAEMAARELCWEAIPIDAALIRAIKTARVSVHSGAGCIEIWEDGYKMRARRDEKGEFHDAQRADDRTHADLAARLARAGFRFPTSDEWEYLCGSGTSTLFRWGDNAPCDRYPTYRSPAETMWHRHWLLSGGRLDYPREGFASAWDLHRRPNAFGLFIASNPYKCELVAEPELRRGGDGGGTICGGEGFFVAWLALATAYREQEHGQWDPQAPLRANYTVGRRLLPLS